MGSPSNTYEGRWRYWYAAIADLRLANPGISNGDIADQLGKHANTISLIVNTDQFRAYYDERRREFEARLNEGTLSKLHKVHDASLDVLLEHLEKKRDKLPVGAALAIFDRAGTSLGYGKNVPGVQVNVQNNSSRTVNLTGVSVEALEEARAAIRNAQQKSVEAPIESKLLPPPDPNHTLDLNEEDFGPLPPVERN